MTNKDTIDKLNRLEFFYWTKPTKTPEVLKQDIETVERDFALIRKDLEVLEILKELLKSANILKENGIDISKYIAIISDSTNERLKEWLEDETLTILH